MFVSKRQIGFRTSLTKTVAYVHGANYTCKITNSVVDVEIGITAHKYIASLGLNKPTISLPIESIMIALAFRQNTLHRFHPR